MKILKFIILYYEKIVQQYRKIKNQTGITLITLVITIILLLILAGISIVSLKNNGIIEKAAIARNKYKNAQIEEEQYLNSIENEMYLDYTTNNSINSEKILKDMNLDEYIYIDSKDGNDYLGNGTKSNPYKTLDKIVEDGVIQNNKSYGILLLEGNYNLTSDMFNLNCNKKIVFMGKCRETILNIQQIGGNTWGTGNGKYDLDFYRMIWNTENSAQNYINTQNNINLYNILFDIKGTYEHAFFAPRSAINVTINNCLLPIYVNSFIRTDMVPNSVKVINCYGGFSSGYNTAQTNWDYATNYITSNILVDDNYRIIDNEENWKNIGSGYDLDGTKADLGIYGGLYSWEY